MLRGNALSDCRIADQEAKQKLAIDPDRNQEHSRKTLLRRRPGQFAYMGNLTLMSRANLSGQQRHHGHRLTVQGRKLNLVPFAAPVNEHNRPDIATPQAVLGEVAFQNHIFQLLNHGVLRFRG
jgi:hypothetical protein